MTVTELATQTHAELAPSSPGISLKGYLEAAMWLLQARRADVCWGRDRGCVKAPTAQAGHHACQAAAHRRACRARGRLSGGGGRARSARLASQACDPTAQAAAGSIRAGQSAASAGRGEAGRRCPGPAWVCSAPQPDHQGVGQVWQRARRQVIRGGHGDDERAVPATRRRPTGRTRFVSENATRRRAGGSWTGGGMGGLTGLTEGKERRCS